MNNKNRKIIGAIMLLAMWIFNFAMADTTWDVWTGTTVDTWSVSTWETEIVLPQIMIDEDTNTIYVTWYNDESTSTWTVTATETWASETWAIEEDVVIAMPEPNEIDPADEFANALAWMYANGLTMYENEEEFRPYDPLTREEASKIIGQAYSVLWYSDVTKNNSCTFSDSTTFNPTLSSHIWNVCKRGLFKWADGKFMPQDTLTKAQSMAVLLRMFEWKMSYELQVPWWSQYYQKGKIIWLTNVDDINEFDHELTRYEIALMIYRLKNLVTDEQLKTMALNAIWNITINNGIWSMDSETVIDNLGTLVWGIDPNTDPELLEAIYWMYDNWLTMYNNPTDYKPFGTLNRAGAAKIFDKFSNM